MNEEKLQLPTVTTSPAALPMSVQDVVEQVQLIQEIMRKVMKEGEHYGKIPGCGDKPTLLQAGADKLLLTFRLSANYEIIEKIIRPDLVTMTVKCIVKHIETERIFGEGVGSCTSREEKYKYRTQNTGKPVPQEYWKYKDKDVIGGPQFAPKKIKGKWVIFEKIEHDNPEDYQNTILKMAAKRAKVAACITALAASDIFTQDLEDLKDNGVFDEEAQEEHSTQAAATPPPQGPPAQAKPKAPPKIDPDKILATIEGDTKPFKEQIGQIAARLGVAHKKVWGPQVGMAKKWFVVNLSEEEALKLSDEIGLIPDPARDGKPLHETGRVKVDLSKPEHHEKNVGDEEETPF